MSYAIIMRRLSYDLDTGKELSREDSPPIEVSALELQTWGEKGYRPWEARLEKESGHGMPTKPSH